MVIDNVKIVTLDHIIDHGFIVVKNGKIDKICAGPYKGQDEIIDGHGLIAMPGFIDVHVHGSIGIDFMDANVEDYNNICQSLYNEGVTTFLATTLTSDFNSLKKVCETVKQAKNNNPSLLGIHFEGPYINEKFKGAQNAQYIRDPDINEFDTLNAISGGNVRYITMAPEKEGAKEFIKHLSSQGVVVSAGHSDASFEDIKQSIEYGLSNTTHTHNAMSGHHHRNPGIVTAAMYFDSLFCEVICDGIHVCEDALKTFYKIIGPDRFIMITDALKAKNSSLDKFELFGLPCERKNGAAYLTTGPLAGSLLTMEQGLKNVAAYTSIGLIELSKISAKNAAKALHLDDRGEIKEGLNADIVLIDNSYNVKQVYKLGKRVK